MNDQVTKAETAEILRLAEQCLGLGGDFVELGCYRGDTSVLLGKLLASHSQSCGNPVENLCKSPDGSVDKMCKSTQRDVDKLCKNPPNAVEKQCKTSEKYLENPCQIPAKSIENQCATSARRLWIYDSFAGLPEKTVEDASGAGQNFQAGELLVTKREVVEKIRRAGLKNVVIKKAWFDELTEHDLPAEIAFAFLDGDLYGSIKTSLKLVAPRLTKQGIMIVHDYNNPELPGSARAVDEFLRGHREYKLQVRYTLAILCKEC